MSRKLKYIILKCGDLKCFKTVNHGFIVILVVGNCIFLLFSAKITRLLFVVENIGLEPMTPCVQGRCSKPTELIPRHSIHNYKL